MKKTNIRSIESKKVICDGCGDLHHYSQLKKKSHSNVHHERYCTKCLLK